jgi:predicted dehydrogenase
LLIRTKVSVVSAGTERMLVDFGRASLLGKIRQQPEKVREVWSKVRANGLAATVEAIRSKLSQPIPLGYCNVGQVFDSGDDAFMVGERVVSNGSHAEAVSVSARLCAKVPSSVPDSAAAFTPLAAIALQGIHLLEAKPGDKVVVTGLGLIGQLAVRLLAARGCEVLGLDPSPDRREMARRHGALISDNPDPVAAAHAWTKGQGVAGVLITASASSHQIVSQAARSCRRRGRVVLVGVVGLNLNRADFYRNEVSFQVSCSYGERDHVGDGSVRANFEEVLGHLASGRLSVDDLVTQRFAFGAASSAYERLTQDKSALGLVLDYQSSATKPFSATLRLDDGDLDHRSITLVGAGNFATRTLLPALAKSSASDDGWRLGLVVSAQGHQAVFAAAGQPGCAVSTDESVAFRPTAPGAVFICTRHDAHARQSVAALQAGKSVWVEKPLALTEQQLVEVAAAARQSKGALMIGFNRRFAPAATKLRAVLKAACSPMAVRVTVNAGRLDPEHWTLDPSVGGGRIVGEVCHFVDLARYLVGHPIATVRCTRRDADGQDGGCFELTFDDGSVAKIDYRTDLPPEVPKELITVDGEGLSATIHNWARLTSTGLSGASLGWPWSKAPRKGHPEALTAFLKAADGKGPAPIPLAEILEVSKVAIVMQGLSEGESYSF